MGGLGSGKRQFRVVAATTDDYCTIDVRGWRKEGLLSAGEVFQRQWNFMGRAYLWIDVLVYGDKLRLLCFNMQGGQTSAGVEQQVNLEWTACRFGGGRPWFRCPVCDRRAAILYGGPYFACRICLRLSYPSQREAIDGRAVRRAERIRHRLGWKPGIANWACSKPRRMRWQTFERLNAEHRRLVHVVLVELNYRLRRLEQER